MLAQAPPPNPERENIQCEGGMCVFIILVYCAINDIVYSSAGMWAFVEEHGASSSGRQRLLLLLQLKCTQTAELVRETTIEYMHIFNRIFSA